MKNRSFSREVLAAWVVALAGVTIGLVLLAFHEPHGDARVSPRAYAPPAAAAEQSDDGVFVRNAAGWVPPQSGSSTDPDTPPEHR